MRLMRLLRDGLVMMLLCLPALAAPAPLPVDANVELPPVIEDSTQPRQCTIAFLVADTRMNDIYAARMQIAPGPNVRPIRDRYPCPAAVPTRFGVRAMENCMARVADPNDCVFADMSRGFERDPSTPNTAENGSRCGSDLYSFIGIACWKAEGMDVCNVGCGKTDPDARAQARERCESKHLRTCDISGAVPILLP
jgi:hypothetical protein